MSEIRKKNRFLVTYQFCNIVSLLVSRTKRQSLQFFICGTWHRRHRKVEKFIDCKIFANNTKQKSMLRFRRQPYTSSRMRVLQQSTLEIPSWTDLEDFSFSFLHQSWAGQGRGERSFHWKYLQDLPLCILSFYDENHNFWPWKTTDRGQWASNERLD